VRIVFEVTRHRRRGRHPRCERTGGPAPRCGIYRVAPVFDGGAPARVRYVDGTDDDRKPVKGDVSVRVGLGLAPKTEKILGFDGNNLSNILGLAVNAKGEVFVMTAESTYGRQHDARPRQDREVPPHGDAV